MNESVVCAAAFGDQLRQWRQHRRLSQLALSLEAGISARHLSFVETGRSQPSRELVLRLAQRLEVPLRERNAMLMAAGYAPMYPQRSLDDPALSVAREAVERVLMAHEPHPALAIDRHWNMVMANRMIAPLLAGVPSSLLVAPVNVLLLSLHPQGLAPRILNLPEWRAHLFERLGQQIAVTADPRLRDLLAELEALDALGGALGGALAEPRPARHALAVPLRLATPLGELALISTTTIFGTPVDVTLSELAIESFFPADAATAQRLRALHAGLAGERDAAGGR
ncbi:helix-turn-helix domain-containing protein [Quisquiliibacterium transsilvanicum]|uniref:Transcriptional regulator with XRE-family HTH domain n=1 Tax=Quisquiliibacterium transsilvanicum TaxID=1549638 RepID=A0A7W8HDS9_9BURK|nr:helix-turn-helix transcriptional regulator [Quisquiliibacterium transsilvanicum]MBB5270204.1 transcriptional regulator with XRE-family HTH domain [Quisquiliibacterium transsilvanicum]